MVLHDIGLILGDEKGFWVTQILEDKPVRMQVYTGAALFLVSESMYKKKHYGITYLSHPIYYWRLIQARLSLLRE